MKLYSIVILFFFLTSTSFGQNSNVSLERKFLVVDDIKIEGLKITKEFVVYRELALKKGDTVLFQELESILEQNKKRVLNSKLFSKVDARYEIRDSSKVDFIFEVKELLYWTAHPYVILADRNFNVWWYEMNRKFNRLNIGADINRKNFRGRNEEIGGEFQVGFNKHIYLYYVNPYLDKKLKHGMQWVAAYNTGREIHAGTDSNKQVFYRNENENPYRSWRLEVSHLYRPNYAGVHKTQIGIHHIRISDSLKNGFNDYLGGRSELTYLELQYDYNLQLTDDRNYPEQGFEWQVRLNQKGLGLSKQINQLSLYSHLGLYQKLSPRFSACLHARGRVAFPAHQPFLNERALGFKNDFLRGYEYYLMDGSHFALVRGDIRCKLFEIPFKQKILPFLQYVPIKVMAKTYSDVGYVYNKYPGNSFLNNRFLYSYGVGLDIVVSYYVRFRLEHSINQFGENGLFLHGRKE